MFIKEIIDNLKTKFLISEGEIAEFQNINKIYPMKISKYYLNLIKEKNDAIWKQCIPSIKEIEDLEGIDDPLFEEKDSPVPLITHRYPDRVLFLISDTCDMFCRFCTRKRKVGINFSINDEDIDEGLQYIKNHQNINDVILSGGDALCVSQQRLTKIIFFIAELKHVSIIRIGTRLPCVNPKRISKNIITTLTSLKFQLDKNKKALYMNIHFEHPDELTDESIEAIRKIANLGIPLGNQNVLLKNINDDVDILKKLYQKLVANYVKPYYMFQADLVKGTHHFKVDVDKGKSLIRGLQGFISGLCIPHYVIDAPDGKGKIPILPKYEIDENECVIKLKNYKNEISIYNKI